MAVDGPYETIQSVYEITTDKDLSTEEKINRLLTLGAEELDLPYGFLSRITVEDWDPVTGNQQILDAFGDHELLQAGESAPLSKAYCRKTIQSEGILSVHDAVEGGWEGDPAFETFDLGTYIGGKVEVGEELYGTFCFAATDPKDGSFTAEERSLVRLLSKWASYELEREEARRKLEATNEELVGARERLRQVIDMVPDLIFAKNREGEYLLANEATANAYGMTPEELEGRTEADFIPEVSESEDFRADDLAVIESGEPKYIPEETLTTADGETRILETRKIPFETADSGEPAVLGYARDITERKRYEEQLETQRDNLSVLNQVVRHDIRNDLQLILAYTELLTDYLEDSAGETYVDTVLEAAREAVEITETAGDITDVMLQEDVDLSETPLVPILGDEVEKIRGNQPRAVIVLEGPMWDVQVRADELLRSVFRNLLKNAIIHNDKPVPEITVSTERTEGTVAVRIADNGPGIPDEQRGAIFGEGQKGLDSEGTGLGLYLVDTLVDRYGGSVSVEDNEPEGSVFVVELPVVEG